MSDIVQLAINCRYDSRHTNGRLGLCKAEILTMRRVMKETEGRGGPWFEKEIYPTLRVDDESA